jgi:hypothetical protein
VESCQSHKAVEQKFLKSQLLFEPDKQKTILLASRRWRDTKKDLSRSENKAAENMNFLSPEVKHEI